MKLNSFSSKKNSRFAVIIIMAGSIVFFFNCTPLYFSSSNCVEDETHKCKQYGDVGWLAKKSMDVLITLDNSSEGQDLNPQIASSLNQFLKCIEAIDYRVGVISGVADSSSEGALGHLINTEVSGQVSTKKFVSADTEDYKKVFSDTIALKSGCSYPPYCRSGSRKPLSAVKFFMKKEGGKNEYDSFLRGYAPLAVIVITTAGEKKGMFSKDSITAQEALASIHEHYREGQFIGSVVTDYGKKDDCIDDGFGNFISKGIGSIATVGGLYSMSIVNPWGILAYSLLLDVSKSVSVSDQSMIELVKFAKNAGGYVFDICKPSFGKGLAYSLLKKLEMEKRFPDECKEIRISNSDKVAESFSVR